MVATFAGPWIESPFFEQILAGKNLSPAEQEICRRYHRDGYLVFDDDLVDQVDLRHIEDHVTQNYDHKGGRLQDGWRGCHPVRAVATNERVLSILRMLYDREPVPFQTLNFLTGTEQRTHSDFIHFSSLPSRFMCGVWVALEDITLRQGALHYFPASQRLPEYDYYDLGISEEHLYPTDPYPGDAAQQHARAHQKYLRYEQAIDEMAKVHALKREELEVKRGRFMIWSANLFHGGSTIVDRTTTRRSQVTHYFFEDTIPITPMFGNAKAGDYYVRQPTNIRTGTPMRSSYDGLPFTLMPSPIPLRSRLEIKREPSAAAPATLPAGSATGEADPPRWFDGRRAATYIARYPDVAASLYGKSRAGAWLHYLRHGRAEGRIF
jgi:phytanoyl-CoA dioxygenase PhyH